MQISPFKVSFADDQLALLKSQLRVAHIARPTFEAGIGAGTDDNTPCFGLKRDWLVGAKEYWEKGFDWRKAEARINALSHYTALIPSPTTSSSSPPFKLHFIHSLATRPHPRTILFIHGWPGSFLEFIDIVSLLREGGDFNVVVASSPGYAFSDPPPRDREFCDEDVAELLEGLMRGLRYDEYAVQVGDWGQTVARLMAIKYPAVGEKFLEWSDETPSLDEILTSATLWWLTDTFPTSIYTYRDPVSESGRPQDHYIPKPTGFSSFHREILPSPRSWAEKACNLQFYRSHASGGHFAALEKPQVLAADLREFLDLVWPLSAAFATPNTTSASDLVTLAAAEKCLDAIVLPGGLQDGARCVDAAGNTIGHWAAIYAGAFANSSAFAGILTPQNALHIERAIDLFFRPLPYIPAPAQFGKSISTLIAELMLNFFGAEFGATSLAAPVVGTATDPAYFPTSKGSISPVALDFYWGTALSAFQSEGYATDSNWKRNVDRDGEPDPYGNSVEFWTRWPSDVLLARDLGTNTFRIGVSWARIEPLQGQFNETALRLYGDMMQAISDNGMTPMITLDHFGPIP
ncbi:hypothetical protein RQP46_007504 [Phenoliferia psychrophenolica]